MADRRSEIVDRRFFGLWSLVFGLTVYVKFVFVYLVDFTDFRGRWQMFSLVDGKRLVCFGA